MRITHIRGEEPLGTRSVAELIGVSYSRLNRWLSAGLIGGDPVQPGSGQHIILDEFELEQAAAVARLAGLGVPVLAMGRAMAGLRAHGRPSDGDVLVVFAPDGESVVWRAGQAFPNEPAWCVPLVAAVDVIDRPWVTVERDDPRR